VRGSEARSKVATTAVASPTGTVQTRAAPVHAPL
jgi:hypothetical protein